MIRPLKNKNISRLPNKDKRRRIKNTLFLILAIIISVFILWGTVSKAWNFFAYRLIDFKAVEYGKTYWELNTKGLLIKSEIVVNAPVNGQVKYLTRDGVRVHTGEAVVNLKNSNLKTTNGLENSVLYTPAAGVFCLHLDGYEQILSIDKLDVLQIPKLEKISIEINNSNENGNLQTLIQKEIVKNGEPVYKLVDNLHPIIINMEVSKMKLPENLLRSNNEIGVYWQKHLLSGVVVDYKNKGTTWDILLKVGEYPDDLIHYRIIKLSVISQKQSGVLVNRKSIVLKDGQPGIYIMNKLKIQWFPVKIKGQSENKVIISGEEIAVGTLYAYNPVLYKVISMVL